MASPLRHFAFYANDSLVTRQRKSIHLPFALEAAVMAKALKRTDGPVISLPLNSDAGSLFYEIAGAHENGSSDPWSRWSRCYGFFINWMREQHNPAQRREDPAEIAARFMEHHFREPLSMKEPASDMGMSREHFTRLFIDQYAMAPSAYLRGLRATHARRLYDSGDLPLKEIALSSGGASPSQKPERMQDALKDLAHH